MAQHPLDELSTPMDTFTNDQLRVFREMLCTTKAAARMCSRASTRSPQVAGSEVPDGRMLINRDFAGSARRGDCQRPHRPVLALARRSCQGGRPRASRTASRSAGGGSSDSEGEPEPGGHARRFHDVGHLLGRPVCR